MELFEKMTTNFTSSFTTSMPNYTAQMPTYTNEISVRDCPPLGIQLKGLILYHVKIVTFDVILGLLGNIAALWIFFRMKNWNANTMFLINMVIADFLVLLSLPLRIDAWTRGHWIYGDGLCRINLFLMFSNRSASIGLMTVVAIYRYFKVVHPHHRFNRMTKKQAGYVLALVWLFVISPRIPMLTYTQIKKIDTKAQCFLFTSYKEESWTIIFSVIMNQILTVVEFFIPLAMLLFCSARISCILRQRKMDKNQNIRRAMRVCVAINAVFVICFLPGVVATIALVINLLYYPDDCDTFYTITQMTIVSLGLNFLNSALDPIIYCFSSSMFRDTLISSLPKALRCCGQKEQVALATSSGSQSTTQQEPNLYEKGKCEPI